MRVLDFSDSFESAVAPTPTGLAASGIVFTPTGNVAATDVQSAIAEVDSEKVKKISSTDNHAVRFDGTTGEIQGTGITIDDSNNVTGVNDLTVGGNFTVNGTTTTVNTSNLNVTDKNVTVNSGGDDASSEGAGLTIDRTGTKGSVIYAAAAATKFKVGASGAEVEIADISTAQTLTNKTLSGGSNTFSSIPESAVTNLTTDLSGKASTTLNNLGSTAINAPLVFDTASTAIIQTKDVGASTSKGLAIIAGGSNTAPGKVSISGGIASAADTNGGQTEISTGSATGIGVSGELILSTGSSSNGASGDITLVPGTPSGSGTPGNVKINSDVLFPTNGNLGDSSGNQVSSLYAEAIMATDGTTFVVDVNNRQLWNAPGAAVLDFSGTDLDVLTRKITNVQDPTSAQDAATKGWVESKDYIQTISGDGSASGTSSSLTLATVNSNVGSFGAAGKSLSVSVNAKGLVTAAAEQNIQITESQVTNLVSDLAGKQATGNYITALTGDVTASGPGSVAATIGSGVVTDAKASLANKPPVTVVATTNQTLSGVPTIDGQLTTANQSIVLNSAQTAPAENGPWIVQSGAWTRPSWFPSGGTTQAIPFSTYFVRLGTTYAGSTWRQTTNGAVTIDTTSLAFAVVPRAINSSTTTGTLPVANGGTGTTTAFTQGSVVFAGASGTYTQDNAKLFWDDTNFRLGIGNAAPAVPLDVTGVANASTSFAAPLITSISSTLTVRPATPANAAGNTLTISGGNANGSAFTGGLLTLQAGTAAGSGNGGGINITATAGSGANNNGGNVAITAGSKTGSGTTGTIKFTTQGAEAARFDTGNLAIGFTAPVSKVHIDAGTSTASDLRFTANTTTGRTSTDGFSIGIDSAGNGVVTQFEALDIIISANGSEAQRIKSSGSHVFPATNTAGGTTGNQTINKISGTVNFAAAATSLTVTNSLVSTSSIVFAVVRTNDSTATIKNVVPGSGSFVINLGAAATAETSVGFWVIN